MSKPALPNEINKKIVVLSYSELCNKEKEMKSKANCHKIVEENQVIEEEGKVILKLKKLKNKNFNLKFN